MFFFFSFLFFFSFSFFLFSFSSFSFSSFSSFLLFLGSSRAGTGDPWSSGLDRPFGPWPPRRRSAADGGHSLDQGGANRSPALENSRKRDPKTGSLSRPKIGDSRRRQPRTGAWEEGEEGREEEGDLPQPPETSPASNYGENRTVSATLI